MVMVLPVLFGALRLMVNSPVAKAPLLSAAVASDVVIRATFASSLTIITVALFGVLIV